MGSNIVTELIFLNFSFDYETKEIGGISNNGLYDMFNLEHDMNIFCDWDMFCEIITWIV